MPLISTHMLHKGVAALVALRPHQMNGMIGLYKVTS